MSVAFIKSYSVFEQVIIFNYILENYIQMSNKLIFILKLCLLKTILIHDLPSKIVFKNSKIK